MTALGWIALAALVTSVVVGAVAVLIAIIPRNWTLSQDEDDEDELQIWTKEPPSSNA